MQTGCTHTRWVKPREIYKLDGARGSKTRNARTDLIYKNQIRNTRKVLEGKKGQSVEVVGSFDVIVKKKDGTSFTVTSPVQVKKKAAGASIRGSNRAETYIDLRKIESLGIRQNDNVATYGLLVACVAIAGAGLATFVLLQQRAE